jgi:beta-galactosidase/beta-glucuronidase
MHGNMNVTAIASTEGSGENVVVEVLDMHNKTLISKSGQANKSFMVKVPNVKTWSPDQPNLYNYKVTLGNDVVSSYTGFRTISRGIVNGVERPLLNGEFVFQFGTLDQGFWPDGKKFFRSLLLN